MRGMTVSGADVEYRYGDTVLGHYVANGKMVCVRREDSPTLQTWKNTEARCCYLPLKKEAARFRSCRHPPLPDCGCMGGTRGRPKSPARFNATPYAVPGPGRVRHATRRPVAPKRGFVPDPNDPPRRADGGPQVCPHPEIESLTFLPFCGRHLGTGTPLSGGDSARWRLATRTLHPQPCSPISLEPTPRC